VQSWAVISKAADGARQRTALAEADRQLIKPSHGIAMLFTPPFDKTPLDPGYIKGYPPGIRENGGQYTHAACWMVFAFAQLGIHDRAHALLHMLNPINHSKSLEGAQIYRVEPYVVAADIYSAPGYPGRGGWTWYTGSAGWLYQAGLQAVLGLEQRAEELHVNPCIPADWEGFEITLRRGETKYEIKIIRDTQEAGAPSPTDPDEAAGTHAVLRFTDDGKTHHVRLTVGQRAIVKEPFAA
jgi:cyclic beta-1,2-glucan synthetase